MEEEAEEVGEEEKEGVGGEEETEVVGQGEVVYKVVGTAIKGTIWVVTGTKEGVAMVDPSQQVATVKVDIKITRIKVAVTKVEVAVTKVGVVVTKVGVAVTKEEVEVTREEVEVTKVGVSMIVVDGVEEEDEVEEVEASTEIRTIGYLL